MINNILIISSDYTGHGHKSITDSLNEQFSKHPNVKVKVVDGFTLAGNIGLKFGKLYGSVTRNAKELWRLVWDISIKNPKLLTEVTELSVHDNFIALLKKEKPDLILCVHPNFNGSILNVLERYNIKIPFVTLIADLVSITPLWADARADYTICPTIESKNKCLEFGVPENKLKVIGFPSRANFYKHLLPSSDGTTPSITPESNVTYPDRPLECLIMSGGEGVGNMRRIADILLKNFNCIVKIIAGRNKLLKNRLETSLTEKYPGRVEVFGFVENVQDLMLTSDITFARGSPNVMMEAVLCNSPLVITGALPGQEEGNPAYAEKYNLGVVCKELRNLKRVVSSLLANNSEKLNQIKKSQQNFRNPNIAKDIVDFLLSIEKSQNTHFPEKPKKRLIRVGKIRTIISRSRARD